MAQRKLSVAGLLRAVERGSETVGASTFGKLVDAIVRDQGHVRVIRPDDLLVLDFAFSGLRRSGALLKRRPGKAALIVVELQTQSLADEAFANIEDQKDEANDLSLKGHEDAPTPTEQEIEKKAIPQQVGIRAAGSSRLVFEMPADEESLEFSLESLLDACRRWPMKLDAAARPVLLARPMSTGLAELAAQLELSTEIVKQALGDMLTPPLLDRLDTAAERLANRMLTKVRRGATVNAEAVGAAADRYVAALVRGAAADQRAAARLYLYHKAAAQMLPGLATEHGWDIARVTPGIYDIFGPPHPPHATGTAIELPWRLIGSPIGSPGFAHALRPVSRGGRTELWHTRLGERRHRPGHPVSIDERAPQQLRYLWSPDYGAPVNGPVFSLDGIDREMIVKLTAGYTEPGGDRPWVPRPVSVRRLMLSALGGLLDAERRWDIRPVGVDLRAWTHRANQARDFYVRVEYSGFLFPFGHAATLVKLTERSFEWRDENERSERIAVLRQRFFIIVRERFRTYPRGAPQPYAGRAMPFESVECLVETTPDFATPGGNSADRLADGFYVDGRNHRMAFWPSRGSEGLYFFPMMGIDAAGRRIAFSTPLMFVSEVVNTGALIPRIREHYRHAARKERRQIDMRGATVRFAETDVEAADVDLPTISMLLSSADPSTGLVAGQAARLQQQSLIEAAEVRLAAIERLTGQVKKPRVVFDPQYLADGFSGVNKGELFLTIDSNETLEFGGGGASSDTVGGLATPSMVPAGLSRRHGIASAGPNGLASFAAGTFDPADFFPSARILGFFELKSLLKPVPLGLESPQLTTTEYPEYFESRFRLVQSLPNKNIEGLMTGEGGGSGLELTATTKLNKSADPPEATVEGTLTNFKINLAGVLIIHFNRLHYLKESGRKPDIDVDLDPRTGVTFGGPLEFLNTLKDYIPANGFSDPPDLQVTPAGITASYALGLPSIQCGVLSFSNINLAAAFSLPFDGEAPTARFNFAERHNTFNLTVSLFGGGGFFAIVASTSGVREIEAALEFGAQIAVNLGVASGSVYVKGGFYFRYAPAPDEQVEFEGYVEMGGRLSVLGLISVSLVFHLSLAYESQALEDKSDGSPNSVSRLFGQASLVVEIEILFFSKSVRVKVEKTFAGSKADPLFVDFIPRQSVWGNYCDAFA